jgi:hypothetical protein
MRFIERFGTAITIVLGAVALMSQTPADTARNNLRTYFPDWFLSNIWLFVAMSATITIVSWLLHRNKEWFLDFLRIGKDRHKAIQQNEPSLLKKDDPANNKAPETQKTIFQLFQDDFGFACKFQNIKLTTSENKEYNILPRIHLDFSSGSRFVSCYMPSGSAFLGSVYLAQNISKIMADLAALKITSRRLSDASESSCEDLVFTGNVFVYHEDNLTLQERATLDAIYKDKGLNLRLRGQEYAKVLWLQKIATQERSL